MNNLVSTSEISTFTGVQGDLFNLFKRPIVVIKEPQKTVTNVTSGIYAGYGDGSDMDNITYIPISGIYYAKIRYTNEQDQGYIPQLKTIIEEGKGKVTIKVEEDCKNFIENGKTLHVIVDNQMYNLSSRFKIRNYLGLTYYQYDLEGEN